MANRKPNNRGRTTTKSFVCKYCHATVMARRSGPGAPWILMRHHVTRGSWGGGIVQSNCVGSEQRP